VTCGDSFSVATLKDGSMVTWGLDTKGQLGNNNTSNVIYATPSSYLPIVCNSPPSVSLTVTGTLVQPTTLSLSATATDLDGSADITKVDFYDGTSLLGTATALPYLITLNPSAGDHSFYAMATDVAGATGTSQSVPVTVLLPPATLTVSTPVPAVSEISSTPGIFRISRTGTTSVQLPFSYTINGTATSGSDYALSGSAVIQSGSTYCDITVSPIPDRLVEGDEQVVMTLTAGNGYNIGDSGTATVTIQDAPPVAKPVFSLTSGYYGSAQSVGVSCTTSGAVIHYTVNGDEPTENDPVVSATGNNPLLIPLQSGANFIRAEAFLDGFPQSDPATVAIQTGTKLVGGEYHSMDLGVDGNVWAWGDNYYWELGNGSRTDQWTPQIVPNLSGVIDIAAGDVHSIAVKSDGSVWCWGDNQYGELGESLDNKHGTPIQVAGISGATTVASKLKTTFAVTSGTVWAWGYGANGELGNGSTLNSSTPVQVSGLGNIIQVAAGDKHGLALKNDGTVWGWGLNTDGEIGDGTTNQRLIPVQVQTGSNVVQIAAGLYHSIALKDDGTVLVWGRNLPGVIGNSILTPQPVPGLNHVVAIAAEAYDTLALLSNSTVVVIGSNDNGELGNGTTSTSGTAWPVSGVTGITSIGGGWDHTMAVLPNNGVDTLLLWGFNNSGQIGNGTNTDALTPVISQKPYNYVSVTAYVPSVLENSTMPGVFRINRVGPTTSDLTVTYNVDGSAAPDVNYTSLEGSVVIPSGASFVDVEVTPIVAHIIGKMSVNLTLASTGFGGDPSTEYFLGTGSNAVVNVMDVFNGIEGDGFTGSYDAAVNNPSDTISAPSPLIVVDWTGGGDYATIQDAIDNVTADYSIIYVRGGNYSENINISNHKIMLITGLDGGGSASIDGGDQSSTIIVNTDSVVIGFAITGGSGSNIAPNGGGITVNQCAPKFFNCVISGNQADDGAAIYNIGGSPIFSNCTIFNNTSTAGGSVHCSGTGAVIANTILWDIGVASEITGDGATLSYCDVLVQSGTYTGIGNINADPVLNPDGHIIGVTSPCVGAAAGKPYPGIDWDGEIRVPNTVTGNVDIGADQFVDSDGDTLPDWWENLNGLDPNNSSDASADQLEAYQNISSGGTQQ